MKKTIVAACAFLALGTLAAHTLPTLALSNFVVHSDNPRYKYMGKGISEMIAVELRKTPGVELVERERRARLLEEAEFTLSSLADPEQAGKIGHLLSADYLVFGELVDLGDEVLISLRMIDARTGRTVWNEKLTEKLSRYDYIAGFFAQSILNDLGIGVRTATAEKVVERKEKNPETVVALSAAVDHYDKQEKEEAKREVTRAKKLDPGSEAAAYLLSKLVVNTTKFKVLMEPYYSYRNPAFLGILRTDYLHWSGGAPAWVLVSMTDVMESFNCVEIASDTYIQEMIYSNILGYALPLGPHWGLGIDVRSCGTQDRPFVGSVTSTYAISRNVFGAFVDAGVELNHRWAAGAGLGLLVSSRADRGPTSPFTAPDSLVASGTFGILYRRPDESLILDARVGWNDEKYSLVDPGTLAVVDEVTAPLFEETTLTLSFDERRTFLTVRQTNEVCFDRVYYYGTLMPSVEHFLGPWFSMRAGFEGAFSILGDTTRFGYGGMFGGTFHNPNTGFELDMNLTYRLRPSRVIEGLLYPDLLYLINLTWNGKRVWRGETY